ncbi:FKBP-type peptidyl-prolyl cis-trans isomerase [Enterovibrio makurazakiensis]|uniref:Peptidyl-prolyl cis-trans isomerase n=1 Tax=Enterovibrio gelatinilyticus TaxID=2899819 RepID=A0ABT5QWF7_9GAMM|nr:FKBP-type peptidyl-prolyl cis-trans isomerase [Enterovibrio sp. ZSDZ42]MDD1792351.1 FKBP-type peptidyl-prolyl cis-trans isomerase [Enterovibrio sp. ZSDZ42]
MDFALPLIIIVIFVFIILIRQKAKKVAEKNKQLGAEFLEKNAQEEGVITTESGLQYKVLEEGEGEMHPTATSRVRVHYHGTLLDGSVFDSSVQRGESIEFGLNQVIKGWTEGVQLMKKGGKTRFFIPSNLAYGNAAAGSIGPGSTLIFEVELLDFS